MRQARLQLAARMGLRARRWVRQRQGSDSPSVHLTSRRIYILPTAPGMLFAAMLATMLAGAMNYNNNLGFALTFLLTGMGIAVIYQTHCNLSGLRLRFLGAEPVFAGEALQVRFSIVNDGQRLREEIFLSWPDVAMAVGGSARAGESRAFELPLPTRRRGAMAIPALRVTSKAPLGLVKAWAWVHLDVQLLVWPRPAADNPRVYAADVRREDNGLHNPGDDDFVGLRSYQPGDSPRRIAWKHFARSNELLARDYRSGGGQDPLWIDWDAFAGHATEERVALLTRMVVDEHRSGHAWGLRLPGTHFGPAAGNSQLRCCLDALATVQGQCKTGL